MTVAEIVILIIGAILFTISFFIPDRDKGYEGDGGFSKDVAEKAAKDAVQAEIKKVKLTIEEATEESIADNKDKMERFMDRLTNEKMMAVSEYSDTVLEQIHKDHQEAVFLYDMIDSKYTQVKSTAAELNQIEKSVRQLSEDKAPKGTVGPDAVKREKVEAPAEKEVAFEPISAPKVEVEAPAKQAAPEEKQAAPAKAPKKETKKQEKPVENKTEEEIPIANNSVELMFDSDSNSMNNNDRILALHKEGKSNMAIAKELGLGVGEVKLVIDLFKS